MFVYFRIHNILLSTHLTRDSRRTNDSARVYQNASTAAITSPISCQAITRLIIASKRKLDACPNSVSPLTVDFRPRPLHRLLDKLLRTLPRNHTVLISACGCVLKTARPLTKSTLKSSFCIHCKLRCIKVRLLRWSVIETVEPGAVVVDVAYSRDRSDSVVACHKSTTQAQPVVVNRAGLTRAIRRRLLSRCLAAHDSNVPNRVSWSTDANSRSVL